jgi:hypothetical protein
MTFEENEADREPPERTGRLFSLPKNFSPRKGAKAQSAAAFLSVSFAPLRGNIFAPEVSIGYLQSAIGKQ